MADRTRDRLRPKRRQPARATTKRVRRRRDSVVATAGPLTVTEVAELDELRQEIERIGATPLRWNADEEDVQRSVAQIGRASCRERV